MGFTIPVGRFSPSAGINVDRTVKSTVITGTMEMYGPEATSARANSVQQSINKIWTQSFSNGYSVTCHITVNYRPAGSAEGNATQIEADKTSGPSHVSPGLTSRSMTLNANEADAFTWTAGHEFGHIIGLNDRYSGSIFSKISGRFGGARTNVIEPGYLGNIMAQHQGALSGKNLVDLATENEPSPYWINDDDHIRQWVKAHAPSEIAKLSTAHKLKAIHVLMSGYIHDDDVSAIGGICRSVSNRTEANAIRDGVDLLQFSSIGQRTEARVIFSKMPR